MFAVVKTSIVFINIQIAIYEIVFINIRNNQEI